MVLAGALAVVGVVLTAVAVGVIVVAVVAAVPIVATIALTTLTTENRVAVLTAGVSLCAGTVSAFLPLLLHGLCDA